MKQLLTIAAFAALTSIASAASITWGFGGKVYVTEDGKTATLGTSYTGSVPYSLALVYVGQNQNSYDINSLSVDDIVGDTLSYAVATSGKNSGKWSPTTKTTNTTAYDDNASFTVLLWDAQEKKFSNVYAYDATKDEVGAAISSIVTVADMSQQGSAQLFATSTSSSSVIGAMSITSTEPITPEVPEPATGALALAGVALLFKRRRA